MNTALVLFNGVWIWMNEILSLVGPTLALALESSWYHFCSVMRNHKRDSLCFLLILFLLETLSLQLSKDDNFGRVMTMIPHIVFRCFGTIYHLFCLTWKMYQTNLKLWSCSPKLSWSLRFCSLLGQSWPKMIMSYGSEL